jgi:hypothetical protein
MIAQTNQKRILRIMFNYVTIGLGFNNGFEYKKHYLISFQQL